jgi:hypothetical protein
LQSRFLVHVDPTCDRFVVRDADSRLGAREAAAVNEWIASGRFLHLMADHIEHQAVNGGMWGGVGGKLVPNIQRAILQHAASPETKAYAAKNHDPDQHFLAKVILPACKNSTLRHDTFKQKQHPGSMPFPTPMNEREVPRFVGEVYSADDKPRENDWELIRDLYRQEAILDAVFTPIT